MKKLWLFPLLLVVLAIQAQSFEGTITWSMKYDMTDPAKKGEMDKAQQSLNDPANQAKVKKLQEQMNTPEMKTMMDNNPQLKAQMENTLKMLQGGGAGGGMNALLPHGFTVKTKNSSSLVKMDGGIMPMEMLYLADKGQSYRLDRTAKTYTVLASGTGARRPDTVQHTITKTNETMIILGYNCTKYTVDLVERGTTIHQIFWTTTEIRGLDMKNLSGQRMGSGSGSMYYEGISGVPLRMEMNTPQIKMVMEVTEVKKESLSPDDFTIPADFKEVKYSGI